VTQERDFLACSDKQDIEISVLSKTLIYIPVIGREGLKGCEVLRIPHCLDNRLIDGGKAVSPKHRPHFTPQKHNFFNVASTLFC
jgi:hypothetical protein